MQYSVDGGTTWAQLGTSNDPNWYQGNLNWWYNNYNNPVDVWTTVHHDLCELSGESCVKFRITGYAYYGISGGVDYRDNNYFAVDNFRISAGESDDIEPIAISLPNSGQCSGYSPNQTVKVIINNYKCRPITNVPVSLEVNGVNPEFDS
ncbi:MAG: hypothetical protein WHW07_12160 [Bacteroidales bacterium]|nr:hypothetical protein [Bacteroidales bacterium]HRS99572.1 hypothetical protein [Bacteroidales bacterium]HRT79654.1 hypothetical protein [Bacteroidales bacterium]